MSAGKGIAACLGTGAFHNGKVFVQYPRTGNAEPQLQKLVEHGAGQTHCKQVVALQFVQTPEEKQACHNEQGLLAQMGHRGKECITQRGAQPFQKTQKIHIKTPC